MQIFVLLAVMGLLLERDLGVEPWAKLGGGWMLAAGVVAYLAPMLATWGGCVWALGVTRRAPGRAHRAINRLHLLMAVSRWVTLGIFFTVYLRWGG